MTIPKTSNRKRAKARAATADVAENNKKVGRPTVYRDTYAEDVRRLCLLGAIDTEIAEFFNISIETFYAWKETHPKFSEAIKAGKNKADAQVADRLFERAMGYKHPDTHISNYQGAITVTPLTREYPPDTVAAIFWLKNRQPGRWRDKQETELSGSVDMNLKAMVDSTQELMNAIKRKTGEVKK